MLDEFRLHVRDCAERGNLISLPPKIDRIAAGNIIAEEAGRYIDQGQAVKAFILLEERRRLGV